MSGHHHVYVVELDPRILSEDQKFVDANPQYKAGMKCLYVGLTGLTPEERFENHKRGYKSAKRVKKYGVHLLPELYEKHNPMTWDIAPEMEKTVADQLRSEGYAVWQQ
jgi:hypothetical protein